MPKMNVFEKRTLRLLVRSHLDHALKTLYERVDDRFILRAERSLEDAQKLLRTTARGLPSKSLNALKDREYDVRAKIAIARKVWKQFDRDRVRM